MSDVLKSSLLKKVGSHALTSLARAKLRTTNLYLQERVYAKGDVIGLVPQPDSWFQNDLTLCTVNQVLYLIDDKTVTIFDASTPIAPPRQLKVQPNSKELNATEDSTS